MRSGLIVTESKMAQFFLSSLKPEDDLQRCNGSLDQREPITINGRTEQGELKTFSGIVQSIEHFPDARPGHKWRVTILEI